MRTSMLLLAASAVLSHAAFAQNESAVEIGTAFGVTLTIPDGGDPELFAGIPGAGTFLGVPSVYATFFPSPSFMLEPQIAFEYNTLSEDATISPMVQLGYLINPDAKASAYVALNGGALFRTGSDLNSGSVGAGFGYRVKISNGAAFRTELLYRRWLSDSFQLNDVSLRFAIGGVF